MAVDDDRVPGVSEFDRSDLTLSPEMHQAQAEMAAERGEEYDPYEFERRVHEDVERMPSVDDADIVEGDADLLREWRRE